MTDDLVMILSQWEKTWPLIKRAADRIEKLGASEAEWQTICDSYAAENQRFSDRIETLESALREISSVSKVYVAKSEDMAQALTSLLCSHRKIALAALEGKDD